MYTDQDWCGHKKCHSKSLTPVCGYKDIAPNYLHLHRLGCVWTQIYHSLFELICCFLYIVKLIEYSCVCDYIYTDLFVTMFVAFMELMKI